MLNIGSNIWQHSVKKESAATEANKTENRPQTLNLPAKNKFLGKFVLLSSVEVVSAILHPKYISVHEEIQDFPYWSNGGNYSQ